MTVHKLTDGMVSTDPKTKLWKARFSAAKSAYALGELKQCKRLLYSTLEQAHDLPESMFAVNTCQIGLAAVYIAQKELSEARTHIQKSINKLASSSDPALMELLAVAYRFNAHILLQERRVAAAETEFTKAIDILTKLGGNGNVQLSYTLGELAILYVTQDRLMEAKTLLATSSELMQTSIELQESAEYVRNNMIYHICESTNDEEKLALVDDGISQMQYHRYKGHPGIKRAINWYIEKLEEKGASDQAQETRERYKAHLTATTK
ncbi:MAG: tetratricopeptide repeat protein [Cyanobacteria bacterium SZAS-4]|nr:tetratricopeptide repeat protein [Cyanobacteria bacterium SZAS-4]